MDKDIQREIRNIIEEIEKKSADGDYIYRGEPEHHKKVSSTLYRRYGKGIEGAHFDIEAVQEEILIEAKHYLHEENDLEILTQLQHYGGKTNLLDFTYDYLIALFFACDGAPGESGRVILLDKNAMEEGYIEEPQSPINRVRDQKSIFVRPPKGFIEKERYETIDIPKCLKEVMLAHLEKYHGIFANTIYNDLHGFIRVQKLHQSAYVEVFKGVTCYGRGKHYEAIKHYTKAMKLNRNNINAYINRAAAYNELNKYKRAIADCTRALELNRNHSYAYNNRGNAYNALEKYDRAIADFDRAIELNRNFVYPYASRGYAYNAKGRYDQAIADYTQAIELNSKYVNAYNGRGLAHLYKRDYPLAMADLTRAIELNSNDAAAYNNRGYVYRSMGNYDQAKADCTRAIELDPNHFRAYGNRGIARLHLGEFKEAESDLRTAKQNDANIINMFDTTYGTIAEFQDETGIMLPGNIVEVLTAAPS